LARSYERNDRRTAWAVALALFWSIASSLAVYPHSVSYFNGLVGGPRRGHEHLLDSNIAWGQDLLYLKKWMDVNPHARPMHVASFGWIDPKLAGIDYVLPPVGPGSVSDPSVLPLREFGPLPGWNAIDVNHLHGTPLGAADGEGSWFHPVRIGGGYAYFRRFEPVAMAGYSIYVYQITIDEANRVRMELGLPPIERAE